MPFLSIHFINVRTASLSEIQGTITKQPHCHRY